jgi:hypothetical protein
VPRKAGLLLEANVLDNRFSVDPSDSLKGIECENVLTAQRRSVRSRTPHRHHESSLNLLRPIEFHGVQECGYGRR